MIILPFFKKINTECDVLGTVELPIKAIDLDNLKLDIGCAALKSCDYLKKSMNNLYFIEISDFHYELSDHLENGVIQKKAEKTVKEGISLKISNSLLIFMEMQKKFNIKDIEEKKVLITFCKTSMSDVIAFSFLSRNLEAHYKPTFCSSISVIPYTKLENIFKR